MREGGGAWRGVRRRGFHRRRRICGGREE